MDSFEKIKYSVSKSTIKECSCRKPSSKFWNKIKRTVSNKPQMYMIPLPCRAFVLCGPRYGTALPPVPGPRNFPVDCCRYWIFNFFETTLKMVKIWNRSNLQRPECIAPKLRIHLQWIKKGYSPLWHGPCHEYVISGLMSHWRYSFVYFTYFQVRDITIW